MILCHKCSGILANDDSENIQGLSGCGCISGWVRGFEPDIDRSVAIRSQITRCFDRIRLYEQQQRSDDWINNQYERAEKLFDLL